MKVGSSPGPNVFFWSPEPGSSPERIQLSLGRVVQAIVLATTGDGRLLVEIEGQQLWARSSIKAWPGQMLTLQVQALSPELMLQSVGTFQRDYHTLLALCLKKGLSLMSWEALGGLLREAAWEMGQSGFAREPESLGFFPKDFSPSRTEHWDLRKLLLASGIFLEAKLRGIVLGKEGTGSVFPDMKVQLLRALHEVGNSSHQEGGLRRMLDMLQGAQSLALLGQERESLQWVASLPPWWMPKGSWGDLRISQWVRGKNGVLNRGWSVTLRMEMDDMGRLLLRVYLLGELLGCELKASREDVRERIREEIESLKDALGGIWPTAVECRVESLEEPLDWGEQELELPENLVGILA